MLHFAQVMLRDPARPPRQARFLASIALVLCLASCGPGPASRAPTDAGPDAGGAASADASDQAGGQLPGEGASAAGASAKGDPAEAGGVLATGASPGDGGAGTPNQGSSPSGAGAPSTGRSGREILSREEMENAIRFWLANPEHAPEAERWRAVGVFGAELLREIWDEPHADGYMRQRAVQCIGYFEQLWVEGFLVELLADPDVPPHVRADAAIGLINHCEIEGRPDVALLPIRSFLLDDTAPFPLRQRLPSVLVGVAGERAEAALLAALRHLSAAADVPLVDPRRRAPELPPLAAGASAKEVETRQLLQSVQRALVKHSEAEELRNLLDSLNVIVASTRPKFTPASPESRREGVQGRDFTGEWRHPIVTVSVTSEFDEARTLRIDFDASRKGVQFVDRVRRGGGGARMERLRLVPGRRAMASRKVAYRGAPIELDVWVYLEGLAEPVHKERLVIEPKP